ncbi:MAG: hypothetical protein ACXVJD_16540, partial [Mucilaginibacter sp.]
MDASILQLYQKFIDNACSDQELEQLFAYFGTADPNELSTLVQRVADTPGKEGLPDEQEAIRLGVVRQRLTEKINARRRKYRSLVYSLSAAAILLIALSVGVNFFLHTKHNQPEFAAAKASKISPGIKQATLTLANGKKIVLTSAMAGTLTQQGNTSIQINRTTGIVYTVSVPGKVRQVSYNTLATARG